MISPRGRVFLALLIGIALLVLTVAFLQRRCGYYRPGYEYPKPPASAPRPETTSPSPATSASPGTTGPDPQPSPATSTPSSAGSASSPEAPAIGYVGTLKLIVPVVGVQQNQLLDTFADSRSDGRVHDAIDIPAAEGTPVVAAADGQIIRLFQSDLGGTTIYHLSTDKKLILYYAHLQRYAEGLSEGKLVRQGDVIGYVGDTGNAGLGNYHLHFSIAFASDPERYWEGTNINPYPLLKDR